MLELIGVTKWFPRGSVEKVVALNDIDFTVNPSDFITIIGSNGAGKSTLLNLIAGVYFPDSGKIMFDNKDITRLAEYRRSMYMGRVYQDPMMGTASMMSVEENMAMAMLRGRQRGLGRGVNTKLREQFREALAPLGLGLENRLKHNVGTLSGGQRQTLAIVMATISKPALLLLDEHTASLDPKTGRTILELTEQVVKQGNITTLMVTHNMEQALRLGNRLIVMDAGDIIVDLQAEQKSRLTVSDLIEQFEHASGKRFVDDTLLLRRKGED